jgi:glycosyltransferase involved in cell wall biosynthesis
MGLKVLYVCPLAHLEGHQCSAAITETEVLSEAGHDVTLLTFAGLIDGKASPRVKHRQLFGASRPPRSLLSLNVHVSTSRLMVTIAGVMTLLKAAFLENREGFDVIHVRDATGLLMSLPQALGTIYSGGSWVLSILDKEEYPSIPGAILRLTKSAILYRMSFSRSDYAYLCQNESILSYYSKKFLRGILDGRVFLIPPLSKDTGLRPHSRDSVVIPARVILPEKGYFLSFGSLHIGKDIGTIMEAFHDRPDVILLHAGRTNPRYKSAFDNLMRKYSSNNIIIQDAYIPESIKRAYFEDASAVILSYTLKFTGSTSMLWEACSYAKPVLASDVGDLGSWVRKYGLGLVFRSGDPASFASTLETFLNLSQEEVAKMKANCKRFADDFSVNQWIGACAQAYRIATKQKSAATISSFPNP